ncbi:hypothetical protein ABZ208_37530 [Streptomyces sp. NPDC006208]|uniref:hypothetical protein n=1 Tax=Streptomyces sp. NPDC006208 TaxID=3156734 RepID=UPI0033A38BC4
MALKADSEVSIALATGVLAYGSYQMALPTVADIRSVEKNNSDIQGAERVAAWVSATLVSGIALITKSPSVFVVGGAVVIAASWMTRHADQVDTVSKRAASFVPAPAMGPEGVAGDEVVTSQSASVTPIYGVAV